MENFLSSFYEIISDFGLKLIVAIAILLVGKFIIKYVKWFIKRIFERKEVDVAISTFVISLLNATLWITLIIAALSQLGVQTTSFIAVLGAAGLAIGLALQGSLANFAAGFLIILFRPFKVGDVVDVNENLGIINCINMFSTEMKTFDNRKIIIPNSQIMNNTITNITSEPLRRVDFLFSVAPKSDVQQIKNIIQSQLDKHELILKEPVPFIRVSNITHSSLDFTVRAWSNTPDYWTVFFDITEQVREEFIKNGIGLPVPQFEIHNS
ncbi:MAG: mechanosensitive ion channel [Candidatus Cloacimonetes bacterium]|nr:mechanosensitive ion channel [Candidatus Cloacimonadota bacterium]